MKPAPLDAYLNQVSLSPMSVSASPWQRDEIVGSPLYNL